MGYGSPPVNNGPATPGSGADAVRSGQQATSLRYQMMDLARTRGDVISLGRGDPDLDTPTEIIEGALEQFASAPDGNAEWAEQIRGLATLRRGIADRLVREKGIEVDPDREIVITNGGQEGLFLAMLALLDPGDLVVCPDPRYTSYDQAIGAAGGEIVSIPTGGDQPFELSAASLREHGVGAKLLVFVNPSNPTGACVGPEGVQELSDAAAELGLVVLADEIYEDLVFGGRRLKSFLSADGARERTVLLSGFSKSYAMTGFRVGYLVGPAGFIDAVVSLKATTSGPCPVFCQQAASAALALERDSRRDFLEIYEARRRVLLEGLDELGIPYGPHGGGLFVWADVSRFGLGAEKFCYRLLDEAGVLMFPGNSFGDRWQNWVRMSLLAPEESVREAVNRLSDFVAGFGTS